MSPCPREPVNRDLRSMINFGAGHKSSGGIFSVELEINMILLALLPVTITEKRPLERNYSIDTELFPYSRFTYILPIWRFLSMRNKAFIPASLASTP